MDMIKTAVYYQCHSRQFDQMTVTADGKENETVG